MVIAATLVASLGCLIAAIGVYAKVSRLASETPVPAKVVNVRSERGHSKGRELVYYAQLIFDRKQDDGKTIHCDVPNVFLGIQPAAVGAIITVAPRPTSCVEPDVICETCVTPSNRLALAFLIVGLIFGLICFVLTRNIVRSVRMESSSS